MLRLNVLCCVKAPLFSASQKMSKGAKLFINYLQ